MVAMKGAWLLSILCVAATVEQIEAMFDGLNWLRWQWPGNDAEKEKQYLQQRKAFLKQWFKEWKAKMKS